MFGLVLVSVLFSGALASSETSPAFFWSPLSVDAISQQAHALDFQFNNLETMLTNVCTKDATAPEAFVLFTFEHFTTSDFTAAASPFGAAAHGGILSSLFDALSASKVKAAFPYASLGSEPLGQRVVEFAKSAGIPVVVHGAFQKLSTGSVSLRALNNGQCDVIVVLLNRNYFESDNAVLRSILAELDAYTNGKFVAGLVSQSVGGHSVSAQRLLQTTTTTTTAATFVYMTPGIISGLLVGLLFVVTALIGVCCLAQVQTPTQFCHVPLPPGKEF